MFPTSTYINRRQQLISHFDSGKILLLGNVEASMNYSANTYHFRQDSSFLYFTGLNRAGLHTLIDLDQGTTTVFGDELTMDDIVWTGDLPTISEQAAAAGIAQVQPIEKLAGALAGGRLHYLPPYRGAQTLTLQDFLGKSASEIKAGASDELIQAIIKIRSYKTDEEIVELEKAVRITDEMHLAAMRVARPGMRESEVYAALMQVAHAHDANTSFPPIVTVNGQILHNHSRHNMMQEGDFLLVDCGAETQNLYVGDMTRSFPVSPTFSARQKAVYNVCLQAQLDAIAVLKPGVSNREAHLIASKTIAAGMKDLGLM
ncbi:MAG TPA: M24 family metallopeptidase, partial [Bacteroidetes bacterium]|nr:M24 family metallopeptidase [Bacteroidota bacterium]